MAATIEARVDRVGVLVSEPRSPCTTGSGARPAAPRDAVSAGASEASGSSQTCGPGNVTTRGCKPTFQPSASRNAVTVWKRCSMCTLIAFATASENVAENRPFVAAFTDCIGSDRIRDTACNGGLPVARWYKTPPSA